MSKKRLLTLIVAIALLIGVGYFLYSGLSKERVTILYTNDLQGRILPYEARGPQRTQRELKRAQRRGLSKEKPLIGGSAALATCLKGMRYDLLLDAGDFFQGTPEGDFTGGEAVIEVMNELGYNALTLGNHDYDQGNEIVKRLARMARFPSLGANIIDERTGKRIEYALPYIIKEISPVRSPRRWRGSRPGRLTSNGVRGIRFGIFGITTPTSYCEGLKFAEVLPYVEKCLEELEEKVDIIIGLTHLGIDKEEKEEITDYQLAESVPGIDVIIGGHYEKELNPPLVSPKYGTIICQTKGYGAYLGRLDLVIDRRSKKIVKHRGEIITLWTEKYPPDEEIASLVEKYASQVRKEMDRVIGEALEDIMHDPEGLRESALGNWQTDLMREFAGTEIALQNSFGIRGDIPKGEITRRDVYLISPFGNTLVTMELSGEEIWQILEGSVSEAGVLQVSGLKVIYDPEKPEGERILEIEIKGKPLDPKKTYSLVTNSYLAHNVEPFEKGRNIKDTKVKLRDLEEEYIKSHSPIKSPGIQGRIVRHE